MKKLRMITIFLLCFIFITSGISAIFTGLLIVKAENNTYLTINYSNLHSQTEIEEDEKKYRDNPSFYGEFIPKSPQITVFTYGCGGNLAHWSNN